TASAALKGSTPSASSSRATTIAKLRESNPDCISFRSSDRGASVRSCSLATCWNCDVITDLVDIGRAPLRICGTYIIRVRVAVTGNRARFSEGEIRRMPRVECAPQSSEGFLRSMPDKLAPLRQEAPPAGTEALTGEVARLIVAALNLDIAPADIDPDRPLYGEGLGLDSIDILEIALVVSKQYGVQLRADSEENERTFGS